MELLAIFSMEWQVKDYAEILRVRDAEILAAYTSDFYQGTPAVTRKQYGKGKAYYIAARTAPAQMRPLFTQMLTDAGITPQNLPEGVEYHTRTGEEGNYAFYLNYAPTPAQIENIYGTDLLTDTPLNGSLTLEAHGTAVIRLPQQ